MTPNRAASSTPARSSRRRALILAAARSEFAESGYAGARIERIAARAGVNKQLIFYYFGSKAGLHEATLRGAAADLPVGPARRPSTGAAGADRLRRAITQVFDAMAERPDLTRFIVQEAGDREAVGGVARTVIDGLIGDLRTVISEGQGLGYFRDDADPGVAARHAVVLAVGYLSLEHVLSDPAAAPGQGVDWRRSVADLLARVLEW